MRVLLDECCPRPLAKSLPNWDVKTVEAAGVKGVRNGDLIRTAELNFDVLVTADKNLRYQQKLTGRRLAILELPFNSWPRLRPLVPEIQAALSRIKAGEYLILSR